MNGVVRFFRGLGVACVVLGGLVVGPVAISVTMADVAVAQSASSIAVVGNRRVEASTIRSYFKPVGGRLGPVQIDNALKELYATGLFQDVRISQGGGRITVTVVENPVINRVSFEGNKKVKDEQLTLEVQSKPRGTFSRPQVQADVQRIVDIYRRNGRFDIRVVPKIIDLPNGRVDLVFEITEGGKTGVKEVNFVGNKAYSSYRLRDQIKTAQGNLLSFLQNNDIYDPDRMEADRNLLRRFYLKHGYIDVRIIAAVAEYDPGQKGFVITFTIEEGEQYHFGKISVDSNVRGLTPAMLESKLKARSGRVYNAVAVEKSVEDMTIEAARRGFPFVNVTPRADRNSQARSINITFFANEGVRSYIERINVTGNTRTRDYVIRREFDIAEGDAYNRALIDRAERRLKNLNFFKTVKITSEPGSAPDRVVVNVAVEERSTGDFSVSGGYSTSDGFLGEVSISERNLLGTGIYARAALQYGQRARGFQLSFAEPFFLGYRMVFGVDIFAKQTLASSYASYDTKTYGGSLRLGFQLREDFGLQLRYSIYKQDITLPDQLKNCNNVNPNFGTSRPATYPTPDNPNGLIIPPDTPDCYQDGEASLPVKYDLAKGTSLTSLVGYSLIYNSLDNNLNPTSGLFAELKQDFAGVGGDVNFIRTTGELRSYYEVLPDMIGVLHLQGGYIAPWGGKQLRFLDNFQMGPNLVRGFAPSGIGPRDITPGTNHDALGGTMYWGASFEVQTPIYFIPKEMGVKLAAYVDAGSLWNYTGVTSWGNATHPPDVALQCRGPGGSLISNCYSDENVIRTSVGLGLIWKSPFGPLRFDYAFPLVQGKWDKVQQFRFGGGTSF